MKIQRHKADTGGPRLASATGAWTYSDPRVHARALHLYLEHGINLAAIDDWIEAEPWADEAQHQRVLEWRARVLHATNGDAAEGWGMYLLTLAALNQRERFLHPLALHGKKMRNGRKAGTVGKVRAWVRKYVQKHPTTKAADAWAAFKSRPPKGCTVRENRVGRYIETAKAQDTSYERFRNIVRDEKQLLGG